MIILNCRNIELSDVQEPRGDRLGRWSVRNCELETVEDADIARDSSFRNATVTIGFRHEGQTFIGQAYCVDGPNAPALKPFSFVGTGVPMKIG